MNTVIPFIPKPYFVKNLKDNTLGTLKIAILRKVIGNIIIRSSEQDETISFLLPGKEVVEIPARKLKSREKLTGLKLCRAHEVVDEEVRYNLLQHTRQLANPNSILFGDSVIEDALGLQSRVIYDWAYSLQDIADITTSLQHNALSESGTMWDENKAKLRKSLFQIRYVKAGAIFPHFVSVENVTPELFFHLLACLHFTNRYGAQHTTSGPNVENKIVAIGWSAFEPPLTSLKVSELWGDQKVEQEQGEEWLLKQMLEHYEQDQLVQGSTITDWFKEAWKDQKMVRSLYQKAQQDGETFLKEIKVWKS